MSTKHVKIYADGACGGNPGPGGWAAILQWNSHEREVVGQELLTTNNRMELAAVIEGLRTLKEFCSVTVYTDSQYVIGVMTGWKRKANHDLLAKLDALCAEHYVVFEYVRGHAGHPLNERADALAAIQREKARSAVQAEAYDTCDRCFKRITGDELKRANRRSDYITYCDECNRRNNRGVAIPSGFEQLPSAIADMAPVGAG